MQSEKSKIKEVIKEWLLKINEEETLPSQISALNFGIFEPYGIELIGAKVYDAEDDDWACEEDFEPELRVCPDLEIEEHLKWEEVLGLIVEILKELITELDALPLLQVEHITTGFCDGDLVVVK